jgi:hypothetical protein
MPRVILQVIRVELGPELGPLFIILLLRNLQGSDDGA